ncbi:MAG: hypothetical protein ACOC1I_08425, partial [Spirochaetota bacterium]
NGAVLERLREVHRVAARFQDLAATGFRDGATGNEVLAATLRSAREAGIECPMIYSHPIGIYGHGPGPTIGSFGNQEFVEGTGEFRLHDRTCYALELNVREPIGPWDDLVVMYGQEIDVVLRDGSVEFPAGRQEALHVIG